MEPHRILVADDEPFILRSLAFTLRQEGFQVCTARDGREAYDQLAGDDPCDLAILDIMMPHLSGYEILERLHQQPGGLPCPIVFLTAKGADPDRQRALDLGARAWIGKPFSPQGIIHQIRDILDRNEALCPPTTPRPNPASI